LPAKSQRISLLNLFLHKYCNQSSSLYELLKDFILLPSSLLYPKKLVRLDPCINEDKIAEIAEKLNGYSCREIEKFVIYCHDTAFNQ
jgi:hypothetical protein